MATTTGRTGRAGGASPVDFQAYGDYAGSQKRERHAEFTRPAYPFLGRISEDGSSGYPAQAGRYHLYISWACPWAHRTAIVRKLLGLEDVVSLSGAINPTRIVPDGPLLDWDSPHGREPS